MYSLRVHFTPKDFSSFVGIILKWTDTSLLFFSASQYVMNRSEVCAKHVLLTRGSSCSCFVAANVPCRYFAYASNLITVMENYDRLCREHREKSVTTYE